MEIIKKNIYDNKAGGPIGGVISEDGKTSALNGGSYSGAALTNFGSRG